MAKLSHDAIEALAKGAGFTDDKAAIAAAIALAESGGNPKAHNGTPPDNSYGLWQINMLGSLGPARRKEFHLSSNEDLYDPATNARVAYGIYKRSGFKAWTTYTRGTYKSHLSDSGGSGGSSDTTTPTGTGGNSVLGVGDAINALGTTVFKATANIQGIIIAGVLLVIGIVILNRGVIGKVVPGAKAVKLAKRLS